MGVVADAALAAGSATVDKGFVTALGTVPGEAIQIRKALAVTLPTGLKLVASYWVSPTIAEESTALIKLNAQMMASFSAWSGALGHAGAPGSMVIGSRFCGFGPACEAELMLVNALAEDVRDALERNTKPTTVQQADWDALTQASSEAKVYHFNAAAQVMNTLANDLDVATTVRFGLGACLMISSKMGTVAGRPQRHMAGPSWRATIPRRWQDVWRQWILRCSWMTSRGQPPSRPRPRPTGAGPAAALGAGIVASTATHDAHVAFVGQQLQRLQANSLAGRKKTYETTRIESQEMTACRMVLHSGPRWRGVTPLPIGPCCEGKNLGRGDPAHRHGPPPPRQAAL